MSEIDDAAFKAGGMAPVSFITEKPRILSEQECETIVRGAASRYLQQAYKWHREVAQKKAATNPQKTDIIEQIVARKKTEMQLEFLASKLAELAQSDVTFVVEMHRQKQRGEAFTDEQKQQIAAVVKEIA